MSVGSLTEETIFRGLILVRLRRITGGWLPAVLISTLIFSMQHFGGGFAWVIGIAVASLAFSVVFISSRSLLAAAVAHFLYNMVQYGICCWVSE